jgi:hypothetical protein
VYPIFAIVFPVFASKKYVVFTITNGPTGCTVNCGTEGVAIVEGVDVCANAGLAIIKIDTAKITLRINAKLLLILPILTLGDWLS